MSLCYRQAHSMTAHRYGGMYVDLDTESLKHMGPLLEGHHVLLAAIGGNPAHEHSINNGFMASRPQQDFWMFYLQAIVVLFTDKQALVRHTHQQLSRPLAGLVLGGTCPSHAWAELTQRVHREWPSRLEAAELMRSRGPSCSGGLCRSTGSSSRCLRGPGQIPSRYFCCHADPGSTYLGMQ